MNLMFEWQEQYLTSERCERGKILLLLRVIFFLLYKHTDDGCFDDFSKLPINFQRFPNIFQNCSEGQTNVPEHFLRISENFRRCPKISEDYRRLSRKTRRCFDDAPTSTSTI